MSKHTAGLDQVAILYAAKQTARRVFISSIASTALCVVIMQFALGSIHPLGVICAFSLPILLSTPTTLIMHLKNQQLRAANKQLNVLASTDCLTGAMNRRSFSLEVEQQLRNSSLQNYALLLLDLDNFKSINDTYGHEAGDITLQTMVRSVREHFSDRVPFGRIGGEEFAMFIPNLDRRRANEIAEAVCERVRSTDYSAAGVDREISVSVGVAIAVEADNLSQLLRVADQKLYLAKDKGRNRVEFEDLVAPQTAAEKAA